MKVRGKGEDRRRKKVGEKRKEKGLLYQTIDTTISPYNRLFLSTGSWMQSGTRVERRERKSTKEKWKESTLNPSLDHLWPQAGWSKAGRPRPFTHSLSHIIWRKSVYCSFCWETEASKIFLVLCLEAITKDNLKFIKDFITISWVRSNNGNRLLTNLFARLSVCLPVSHLSIDVSLIYLDMFIFICSSSVCLLRYLSMPLYKRAQIYRCMCVAVAPMYA